MKEPAAAGAGARVSPSEGARDAVLTRHDGHPFARGGDDRCGLCGESEAHILHHPTRIRAACELRGIDPAPLLGRGKR